MESLAGLLSFVRTVEQGSFAGAAARLGISASAVGKNVARLEQHLRVRLLHRTTRRLALTDEGQRFYERCRRILDDLEEAETMMSEAAAAPRGRLRVTLPTIGYRFLLPALAEFHAIYPRVELDLDFNDRLVDIVEGGFDAAIRSGDLADSRLMSRRLGGFGFVICASPAYLEQCGKPETAADLTRHALLRFRFPTTGKLQIWRIGGLAEASLDDRRALLTFSNMEAVREAAIRGMGIGYMPDFLAREAIETGTLVALLDEANGAAGQFWIVWPSSRHLSPKLRVFVDFCASRLFRVTRHCIAAAGPVA